MFNKQQLEDEVYAVGQSRINEFFNALLAGDRSTFNGDTLRMIRQFMDAMHFATTENVVQIFHGTRLFNDAIKGEGKE